MRVLFSLVALLIFSIPLPSNADPFELMDEYENLLSKGDLAGAEITAAAAFKEARTNFPATSPYIAKIGFDLAQFRVAQYKDALALEPIEIAIANLQAANKTQAKADAAEMTLILGLAKFANANDKTSKLNAVKILNNAVQDLETKNRGDDFLYRAETLLSNYYFDTNDYESAISHSTMAIEQINSIYPKESQSYRKAGFFAYFLRGKSNFIKLIENRGKRAIVVEGRWDAKEFQDAMNDFSSASEIYGKADSVEDSNQNDLIAWSYLLLSFGNSNEANLKFDEKSELADAKEKVGKIISNSYGKKISCPREPLVDYNVIFPENEVVNYEFGTAVAYYDVGNDGKATNIRIASSLPNIGFGREVKTALSLGKPKPKFKDLYPECRKDIQVIYGFVVLRDKDSGSDYWAPIRKSDDY